MKVQWKRALQTIVLGTSLLALAGCGSDNVMDIYIALVIKSFVPVNRK